jgi:hypothetical protein
MAQKAMAIATNHPYSPDLDLADFYLFRHVKCLLRGESFETRERLFSAVERILRSLEQWTLTRVFLEWMRRIEQYIETNDDYVW